MFDKIKKLFSKTETAWVDKGPIKAVIVKEKKTRKTPIDNSTLTEGSTRGQVKKRTTASKPTSPPPKPSRKKKAEPVIDTSEKAKATAAGEPYVQVLGIEIDQDNPGDGSFELDWNEIFVARLLKAGYQGKADNDIVDNWFKAVCKNVLIETYENENADPELRAAANRRDLGNGRTEVS